MKRKTIANLLVASVVVSLFLSGCGLFKSTDKNSEAVGNDTENEFEIGTEVTTETQGSSETEIESESQVATNDTTKQNSETNNNTNNGGNGSENKPVEQEEPKHTCNYTTFKYDANNHWCVCSCGATANKGAHMYADEYDDFCNYCGYTRSVAEKPVEPENPVEPETSAGPGNVSWNGGDITLENVGISIPTLEEFNSVGLVPGANNWWTGAEGDKKALSDMNVIYYTVERFETALANQGVSAESVNGFTISQGSIWWSWNGADNHYFELTRNRVNGYYVLTINQSLKNAPYGPYNLANWNRDIVLTLCSFVSSTPTELYSGLYEDLHGTTFISDSGWTTIGDCKVQFDESQSYNNGNGQAHLVYKIKSK